MKVRRLENAETPVLQCALVGRKISRMDARPSEGGEAQGIKMLGLFTLIAS